MNKALAFQMFPSLFTIGELETMQMFNNRALIEQSIVGFLCGIRSHYL